MRRRDRADLVRELNARTDALNHLVETLKTYERQLREIEASARTAHPQLTSASVLLCHQLAGTKKRTEMDRLQREKQRINAEISDVSAQLIELKEALVAIDRLLKSTANLDQSVR